MTNISDQYDRDNRQGIYRDASPQGRAPFVAVDQFGRTVNPGQEIFSTDGYAYRLVSCDSPSYTGYSAGAVTVKAVGIHDGKIIEGAPRQMPASKFALTVRRS